MSNQYHRIGRCNCGATFQARDRWQRSCPACLEARAAAEAAKPVPTCRHCGTQRTDCRHGICPDCRAAKEEAAAARRTAHAMTRFGPCPSHPDKPATHGGVCIRCHLDQMKEARQSRTRRAARTVDAVAILEAVAVLFGILPSAVVAPAATTEIHPEQVAHADQAVIDTTFAIIMADMEL